MSWEKEVQEIHKRRQLASMQGGPSGIDRQHNQGRSTIRERIDMLLDPGSFREQGKMAGSAFLDDDGEVDEFVPANYVLGMGEVEGRRVAVGGVGGPYWVVCGECKWGGVGGEFAL